MTPATDLAWLAGLWDGEGSIGVNGGRLAIQLEMTHGPTVERAAAVLGSIGVHALTYNYRSRHPDRHLPSWYLRINRFSDASIMAEALVPFSTTKREQWVLAIKFLSSRLDKLDIGEDGRVRRGGRFKAKPFTDDENLMVEEFRALNQRGPR